MIIAQSDLPQWFKVHLHTCKQKFMQILVLNIETILQYIAINFLDLLMRNKLKER